jgi:hypothetical protein
VEPIGFPEVLVVAGEEGLALLGVRDELGPELLALGRPRDDLLVHVAEP